jgi:hypothetical protein
MELDKPPPKFNSNRVNANRFFVKLLTSVAHTPHRAHMLGKLPTPACTLCGALDATSEHVLLHCTHVKLLRLRDRLDKTLTGLLTPGTGPQYYQSHPVAYHPIEKLTNTTLYPYATNLHAIKTTQVILDALPETRWYRISNRDKGTITIEHPHSGEGPGERKQCRVPRVTFWSLVAWHVLSHSSRPLAPEAYNARAADIWNAVTESKATSGKETLCWTTSRLLLDILVDKGGCQREQFSNLVNTYHRFLTRCMLQENPAFAEHGGIAGDGLLLETFLSVVGALFLNPPYDGKLNGLNAVKQSLDLAERASNERDSFRAFCFLPLTATKLRRRLLHPRARLLMKFPVDSVPFIPDSYWYGGGKQSAGCYREPHTNMVLLMYESVITGDLPPLEDDFFQSLASWFMSVTPDKNHNVDALEFTGIPMRFYENVRTQTFPQEWKLWQADPTVAVLEDGISPSRTHYVGAIQDNSRIGLSPFKDVIEWDRIAAHVGILPDSFRLFLHDVGIPQAQLPTVHNSIVDIMRGHSFNIFKLYWSLQREILHREKSQGTQCNMEVPTETSPLVLQQHSSESTIIPENLLNKDVPHKDEVTNTEFQWLLYNEHEILCQNYDSDSASEEDNTYVINPQLISDLMLDPVLFENP